ncbi:MAG: flagellar biosynthesis anti-sigma factor FlgM [Halieaceae bacterium]|nr:flagellar biosynthesis anti-sigma factor FlgM [Halieaceae bacterium]
MNGEIKPTSDAIQALYGAQDRSVTTQREEEARTAATAPAAGGADSVELTDKARQLQQLEEKLAEFPAVDSQRVDAIRKAIADGSYKIDAELIAERMLSQEAQQKKSEL